VALGNSDDDLEKQISDSWRNFRIGLALSEQYEIDFLIYAYSEFGIES